MFNQSLFDIKIYTQLLDLTYQVAESLKGRQSPDSRWPDCQQLATKLFFHAATVFHLRQGTKAPLLSLTGGADFFDFASVAVLTRAALETYLTLFEVFFEPANEDEFEFRHALWQLSGFIERENHIPSDPNLAGKFADAQKDIQGFRDRLKKTSEFAALSSGEQKEILKGKRKRDWTNVARAAGFGEKTIRQLYAYYSGYVHADSLSCVQLVTAKTANEQIEHIEFHMTIMMIVMSKMIVDYANKFREAKAVCDKNSGAFFKAEVLTRAISKIP